MSSEKHSQKSTKDKNDKEKKQDSPTKEQLKVKKHNEHVEKLKSKRRPFAIGSVFPSAEENVEKEERKHAAEHQLDPKTLTFAIDFIFERGITLGLESFNNRLHDGNSTFNGAQEQESAMIQSPRTPTFNTAHGTYFMPKPTRGNSKANYDEPEGKKHQIGGVIPDNNYEYDEEVEHDEEPTGDESLHTNRQKMKNDDFEQPNSDDEEDYEGQVGGELENKHEEADDAQERIEESKDESNENDYNYWFRVREVIREPLAEFLATCIAILIGLCANTQTMIYTRSITAAYSNVNLAGGLGATAAIYIAGGISGSHINPAITLMLAIFRGFPWTYVPRYFVAQLLGAFVAAGLTWAMYGVDISYIDPLHRVKGDGATANLFVTEPFTEHGTPVGVCVFQEILAGAILTVEANDATKVTVLALGDKDNAPPGASLGGLIIGLVIFAANKAILVGTAMGTLSGYATNPVRDFGPRIFLASVGYSSELWTHDKCWFLLGPLIGTFAGTILGATVYDTFIYIGVGSPINFNRTQWFNCLGRSGKSFVRIPRRTAKRSHNMVRYVVGRKNRNEEKIKKWESSQRKGEKAV
ncbi:hypothetical protein E3Q24_04071 [Wallemia mellicola]|nr:hypothetical protein E3Q24_04071 [Wallemia mellicola]